MLGRTKTYTSFSSSKSRLPNEKPEATCPGPCFQAEAAPSIAVPTHGVGRVRHSIASAVQPARLH